jgi:hypothetical protein
LLALSPANGVIDLIAQEQNQITLLANHRIKIVGDGKYILQDTPLSEASNFSATGFISGQ